MKEYSKEKFFPHYLFEISLIAMFTVEIVLLLAALFPPAVGREIDFSAQYNPRPEWYFLFLYQLSKYFPGKWTFVGAVLLPGLAFSVILLAPLLDSGPETAAVRRPTAMTAGFTLLVSVIILTILSLL
jgi:cytochrome b6-f complex subunit 4